MRIPQRLALAGGLLCCAVLVDQLAGSHAPRSMAADGNAQSPDGNAQSPAANAPLLRVLSYNIHHGEGMDGKLDLPRIAQVIKSAQPDVVALQEVDQKTKRTGEVDQSAELARLTGMQVVFGGNIRYQGGDYGNAVLSRMPIKSHRNHSLPLVGGGEQRGVLAVEIELPGGAAPLWFLATHLAAHREDAERVASARQINELAAKYPGQPLVLAGDLNDVPDSETLRILSAAWRRTSAQPLATVPVGRPARQIDYILTGPGWKVIEERVLDEPVASDHRPLVAVLRWTGTP